MMMRTFAVSCLAVSTWFVAGCEPSSRSSTSSAATRPGSLPPDLMLVEAPKEPLDVVSAKRTAQEGETVVIRGRIGGRESPFVENRGIFVLVDSSLPTCADNPGDGCKTPWDYCCEPVDVIAAKSLTVQVVGPDGKPLQSDIEGQGGLKAMASIIVRGQVAQKPDEKTMIVRATGIYVEPGRQPRS